MRGCCAASCRWIPKPRTARNLVLELETGERYATSARTTVHRRRTRSANVELRRYLRYHEGEPYDAGKLLRTQFALDDSQFYFSGVEVVDRASAIRCKHLVPIQHQRRKRARNTYSFGAGYGDRRPARAAPSAGSIHVINDRGHRLRVQLQVSERGAAILNARYDVPIGDPVLEKFSVQFLTQKQQTSGSVDTRENSTFTAQRHAESRALAACTLDLSLMHTTTTDDAVNGHLRRRPGSCPASPTPRCRRATSARNCSRARCTPS